MKKEHCLIRIDKKSSVHAMITKPNKIRAKGCVVFSHGFLVPGFESHRMFIDLSNELTAIDYTTILFDYRGSGYSDLEFSEMTIDTEIEDLNKVIDYTRKNILDDGKLFVWGQSLGSGVSSIVVSERNDIDGLILWCLSANLYERYKNNFGQEIFEKGNIYLPAGFNVSLNFLESLKGKDVYESISKIEIPKLFVHGDSDDKAPVELSKTAYDYAKIPKDLIVIPGGNHAFKSQPELFIEAKRRTFEWLERVL